MVYFLKLDLPVGKSVLSANDHHWFIKTEDGRYKHFGLETEVVDVPENYLNLSQNPLFPTNQTKAYRLIKKYPGSPELGTLFVQWWRNKEKEEVNTKYYKYLWRDGNPCLPYSFRCSDFPEYFEFVEELYKND